jgi:hypothetical protein
MRDKLRLTLRIATSIACIVACVLLVELWARSYWWSDNVTGYVSAREFGLDSGSGSFTVAVCDCDRHIVPGLNSYLMKEPEEAAQFGLAITDLDGEGYAYSFSSPYWLAVVVFVSLATVPWVKLRFSLRTFLVATTLIALVLGLTIHSY